MDGLPFSEVVGALSRGAVLCGVCCYPQRSQREHVGGFCETPFGRFAPLFASVIFLSKRVCGGALILTGAGELASIGGRADEMSRFGGKTGHGDPKHRSESVAGL